MTTFVYKDGELCADHLIVKTESNSTKSMIPTILKRYGEKVIEDEEKKFYFFSPFFTRDIISKDQLSVLKTLSTLIESFTVHRDTNPEFKERYTNLLLDNFVNMVDESLDYLIPEIKTLCENNRINTVLFTKRKIMYFSNSDPLPIDDILLLENTGKSISVKVGPLRLIVLDYSNVSYITLGTGATFALGAIRDNFSVRQALVFSCISDETSDLDAGYSMEEKLKSVKVYKVKRLKSIKTLTQKQLIDLLSNREQKDN